MTAPTDVPSFVDAHLHPMVMCVFEEQLLLDEVASVPDVCDLLADDPSLGDFDGVLSAEVTAATVGADTYADGVWGSGEITVSVHSRLT